MLHARFLRKPHPCEKSGLGRTFGPEHPLEARADELHANQPPTIVALLSDMHDASMSSEVGLYAPARKLRMRDRDFEIRAGIDLDAHQKCGAASANILAGCIFFKEMAAALAPADLHGEMLGHATHP